ncbi:MAG: hypothetical protein JXB49_04205 [Bacteroidales bacterium]|nr:hypothetical protein [Bacteroidales bacterium]
MEQKRRPVLLTVLCIISYIGLGWSILNGLIGLLASNFTRSLTPLFKKISDYAANTPSSSAFKSIKDIGSFLGKVIEEAFNMQLATILLSIIALIGVLLMWQLKGTGFYLYLIAKFFIVCIPIIFLGMNSITGIIAIISGFFAMIFIILYATNLKYLT